MARKTKLTIEEQFIEYQKSALKRLRQRDKYRGELRSDEDRLESMHIQDQSSYELYVKNLINDYKRRGVNAPSRSKLAKELAAIYEDPISTKQTNAISTAIKNMEERTGKTAAEIFGLGDAKINKNMIKYGIDLKDPNNPLWKHVEDTRDQMKAQKRSEAEIETEIRVGIFGSDPDKVKDSIERRKHRRG